MGAFDSVNNITIPDPSDPTAATAFRKKWKWEDHETVLIKGIVSVADQEYVTNKYGNAGKRGEVEYRMGNGRFALLDRMIVDWTLLINGMKAPINIQTIRMLPANYSAPILEEIDKLMLAMTDEEQESFLANANGHIVDASNGMNLSLMK
jgi:hypothetical protein